jgi:hypothetical protein
MPTKATRNAKARFSQATHTLPPASRANAHQALISWSDTVYELQVLCDCLSDDTPTPGDLNAARMIANALTLGMIQRGPYGYVLQD